jgi:hypothetical protein
MMPWRWVNDVMAIEHNGFGSTLKLWRSGVMALDQLFALGEDEVENVDPGYYARQAEANANALYRTVLRGDASPDDKQLLK